MLQLNLFGRFEVSVNNQIVDGFYSDKEMALLAYLALESERPIRRDALVNLLWAGYMPTSARANLRMTLSALKKRLPPHTLTITRYTVQLQTDCPQFWSDATHFLALYQQCQAHDHAEISLCQPCRARLAQAVGLYKRPFLDSLTLPDMPPFNAWRQRWQQRFCAWLAEANGILQASYAATPHNLPRHLCKGMTSAPLEQKLLDPAYPLLTLQGSSEQIKTAVATALQTKTHFPDGVWLVAPNTPQPDWLSAIAQTLALPVADASHILSHLANKELLLLFTALSQDDSLAATLLPLLQTAHKLKVLVVAQRPLYLQSEYIFSTA